VIPTVAQQLKAVKARLEESVIPLLPGDAKFAREQATFIITTLDWLLDTHEHQYRYEVVENVDYRALLSAMLERRLPASLDVSLFSAARNVLQEKGPAPSEASIPMGEVLEQNRRLKSAAMGLYTALSEGCGSRDNPTRDLVSAVSIKQARREVAFFKKTGWVSTDDDLGTLLNEQGSV